MLQNAYLLATIGADTAEKERKFAEICQKLATTLRVPTHVARAERGHVLRILAVPDPTERRLAKLKILQISVWFLQIFGGLVLGCIKMNFCKKI